jgi:hypothetical protein
LRRKRTNFNNMKKRKINHVSVTENVWKTTLHFFWNCPHKDFRDYMLKNWPTLHETAIAKEHASTSGVTYTWANDITGKSLRVVWVEKFNIPNHMAEFVHELDHVVHRVMRDKGVFESRDSEESYAYLLEFYFEEILKKIKKHK